MWDHSLSGFTRFFVEGTSSPNFPSSVLVNLCCQVGFKLLSEAFNSSDSMTKLVPGLQHAVIGQNELRSALRLAKLRRCSYNRQNLSLENLGRESLPNLTNDKRDGLQERMIKKENNFRFFLTPAIRLERLDGLHLVNMITQKEVGTTTLLLTKLFGIKCSTAQAGEKASIVQPQFAPS